MVAGLIETASNGTAVCGDNNVLNLQMMAAATEDNTVEMPNLLRSPLLRNQASPAVSFCKSPFLAPLVSPMLVSSKSPFLGLQAASLPVFEPVFEYYEEEKLQEQERIIPAVLVRPELAASVEEETDATTPVAKQSSTTTAETPEKAALRPSNKAKTSSLKGVDFIVDVNPSSAEFQASERMQALMAGVQELWKEETVRFGGVCEEFLANHPELKLTILATKESSEAGEGASSATSSLVGFIVYNINPHKKSISIRRMAVAPAFRRQGRATQFMNWCLRQAGVAYIAVTSLEKALGFYKAFGFRKIETWHTGGPAHPDDMPEGSQVYMEYRPGLKTGKRNKAKK